MNSYIRQVRNVVVSALLLCSPLSAITYLSDITWNAAGVLPTFVDKDGIKKVILTRERGGSARGTYDSCGGSSESYDKHPVFTAAREFFEEAMLFKTVSFSRKRTYEYIDVVHAHNTEHVLVLLKNENTAYGVMYIVDFTEYAHQLIDNFYDALEYYVSQKSPKFRKFREKDRIATVPEDVLMKAVANAENKNNVLVEALVVDPETQQGNTEAIQLRPWLVKQLQPYAKNKPYKQGAHAKVRFYLRDYNNVVCNPQMAIMNANEQNEQVEE